MNPETMKSYISRGYLFHVTLTFDIKMNVKPLSTSVHSCHNWISLSQHVLCFIQVW